MASRNGPEPAEVTCPICGVKLVTERGRAEAALSAFLRMMDELVEQSENRFPFLSRFFLGVKPLGVTPSHITENRDAVGRSHWVRGFLTNRCRLSIR